MADADSQRLGSASPGAAVVEASGDTAILFFSHRPEREWQNKRFVRRDYAKSRAAAEALYQNALQAVEGSGLPVLRATGAKQRGDRFGTRLANAFADAFAQGYDRVIAVGSDCPRLHEVDWAAVADRLAQGTPVLGPTPDRDGVYLIGLTQAQFDRQAFADLPWRAPALVPALTRHLAARTAAPALLPARDDVNSHAELVALVQQAAGMLRRLAARLRQVLGAARPTRRIDSLGASLHVFRHRSRGPPPVASAVASA